MVTRLEYNFFRELSRFPSSNQLKLPAALNDQGQGTPVLNLTPGQFYLLPPHDRFNFYNHSSFYMDNTRTFFISPQDRNSPQMAWWKQDEINPAFGTPYTKDVLRGIETISDQSNITYNRR